MGASDTPCHVIFFLEQKLCFQSNAYFFPRTKITWGGGHNVPHHGGASGA